MNVIWRYNHIRTALSSYLGSITFLDDLNDWLNWYRSFKTSNHCYKLHVLSEMNVEKETNVKNIYILKKVKLSKWF